jgi:beta-lactamase superfamily II metal-dependent hydrolase
MDHMDGLADLVDAFPPANFWDVRNNKHLEEFPMGYREVDWDVYQEAKKKAKHFYRGSIAFPEGGENYLYTLFVANPTKEIVIESNASENWNAMSYILVLSYAGFRLLLGGDATDSIWQELYEAAQEDRTLRDSLSGTHVFKVSHHGLDSSYCGPNILSLVNPRKLVISAKEPTGEGSAYSKYYSWMKTHNRDPTKDLFSTSKGNVIAHSDDDANGKYDVVYTQ